MIRWLRSWWMRRTGTWSPFDGNGELRTDLFAVKQIDGKWVANAKPNDGFYPIGVMREDDLK